MNLSIDLDSCVSCGTCAEICPGHVLALDEADNPFEKYPDHCWYCGCCQADCPSRCIEILFPYLIR